MSAVSEENCYHSDTDVFASSRAQKCLEQARYIWPWQRRRSPRGGNLWPVRDDANFNSWPVKATRWREPIRGAD